MTVGLRSFVPDHPARPAGVGAWVGPCLPVAVRGAAPVDRPAVGTSLPLVPPARARRSGP